MGLLQTLRKALGLRGNLENEKESPPLTELSFPVIVEPSPPIEQFIPVIPTYDLRLWREFLDNNETLINCYIIKKIAEAINQDNDVAVLFFIPITGEMACIRREHFENTLNNIIDAFIKVEEYERINFCKQLLDKHSVNEIIRRSKMV